MQNPVLDPVGTSSSASETLIRNLVHDLRQPLSTIGTCAAYLMMLREHQSGRSHQHLGLIQEQVAEAEAILAQVVTQLTALSDQR